MTKCIVPTCSEIGTHHFPKDMKRRQLWQKAIRLHNLPRKPKICNKHFLEEDYEKISRYTGLINQIKYLTKSAVPSIFPWNTNSVSGSSGGEEQPQNVKKIKTKKTSKCDLGALKKSSCKSKVYLEIEIEDDSESLSKNVPPSQSTVSTQTCYQLGLFSTDLLLEDHEAIHYYTGLHNIADFSSLLKTLSPTASIMQNCLWKNFHLSLEDQFLMLLMKLRRNKTEFELSKFFCVSKTDVSDTIVAWINFISSVWSLNNNWPSQELINLYMPENYRRNCNSNVINATESESSSIQDDSSNTKNIIDSKTLLKDCTLENNIEVNEDIHRLLATKGINIAKLKLKSPIRISKIKLVKPNVSTHKLVAKNLQVKSNMCSTTQKIHIKHRKEMTKNYLILNNDLDDLYAPFATKIVCICYVLHNLKDFIFVKKE